MNAYILKIAVIACVLALFDLLAVRAAEVRFAPRTQTFITSSFGLIQIGFEEYAYIKSQVAANDNDYIRNSNMNNPGYYLLPPFGDVSEANTMQKGFLEDIFKASLSSNYYDAKIYEYANCIYLPKLDRYEFYFDVYSNDVHFLFSGWYGKLAHIIIFTNFDSKKSFVSQAQHFFNLPAMDIEKISYAQDLRGDELHDFFYSYGFADGSKLTGYPFLISISEEEISYKEVLLDLTIYPEEHSDEK